MAKTADQSFYDAALNIIKNGAVEMSICTNQPSVYAATYATQLAHVAMATGDFTLAAGDGTPTGRKATVGAKSSIATDAAGTANWIVLDDGSKILYVTSCTAATLVNPGTVNVPSWKIEIVGPT